MKYKEQSNVKIEKLVFREIPKIIQMYKQSSQKTKDLTFGFPELVNKISFLLFCSSATPLRRFMPKRYYTLVAKNDEGAIEGYVFIEETKNSRTLGIRVRDDYQGKGIGSKLMEAILIKQHGDVRLTVLDNNKRALKLYENYGFEIEYNMYHMIKRKKS